MMMSEAITERGLARVIGLPGAVLLGLGSILGTGLFVSIGIAAGVAGSHVVGAVWVAAMVATFNGLSSAQLAAAHPVSGGTYEYGYRYLNPWLGFSAGWMFLCAKSASAATAALGLVGYVLGALDITDMAMRVGAAVVVVVAFTALVAGGMRRSNIVNALIVGTTVLTLAVFVGVGMLAKPETVELELFPSKLDNALSFLHAVALMFVAYTGYGRIATLGEEVRNPRQTIPRAIVITLAVSLLLYAGVAWIAVGLVGGENLGAATAASAAPLEYVARGLSPQVVHLVRIGAVTAMAGVLLNLLLGLSRVALAMGRRGDMPAALARLDGSDASPRWAVYAVGTLVAGLVLVGRVETTWSLSAFTVLIYYALTNWAALRLNAQERFLPRWISVAGLVSCLGLAFWVEPQIWGTGLGLLLAGAAWRWLIRRA